MWGGLSNVLKFRPRTWISYQYDVSFRYQLLLETFHTASNQPRGFVEATSNYLRIELGLFSNQGDGKRECPHRA